MPQFVDPLTSVDDFFHILIPTVFISDIAFVAAVTYPPQKGGTLGHAVDFASSGLFSPVSHSGIAASGLLMRNVWKVDLLRVKELTMGLVTLHPAVPPAGIGVIFYVHVFLVSVLLARYIPFSKIMHSAGVFLSPTRNMANNNQEQRHINP